MDLTLTEEQAMLTEMARDFLGEKFPREVIDEIDAGDQGYAPGIWAEMAELGWTGLVLPEQYDGAGMGFQELALLLEEIGKVRPISPFFTTVVLGALPILDLGSDEQKAALLPKIARGESVVTLALTESSARYDAAGVALRAVEAGDDFVLTGTKLFVPDAHLADHLLCVVRTKDGAVPEEGITIFLVDPKSPGVAISAQKALHKDVVCEIVFDAVKVPKANVLGRLHRGWGDVERILDRAAVAKCCEMVGGAQRALDLSVEYAKERKQFGQLIGSFQAIQHHCANMLSDVDSSRMITYEAVWRISEGMPFAVEASMAKSWTSEAYKRVTLLGIQIHGGSGLIVDHDMHRFFEASRVADVAFGDARYQRDLLIGRLGY